MKTFVVLGAVLAAGVAAAKDPPDASAIKKLVAAEAKSTAEGGESKGLYTDTMLYASAERGAEKNVDDIARTVVNATYLVEVKPSGIRFGLSRDGQSAWLTYSAGTEVACESCTSEPGPTMRISELVVKVGGTWKVHAEFWSEGVADAKVNKAAKAGKMAALDTLVDTDTGDAAVREAFAALTTKGFDPALAANKELIGIGTAPKEMTVGGKGLVPYINKKWVGNMTVKGPLLATLAPSGTSAAVFANVDVKKTEGKATYTVPMRWFVVFDKDAAGTWTPVHVHFSVVEPT